MLLPGCQQILGIEELPEVSGFRDGVAGYTETRDTRIEQGNGDENFNGDANGIGWNTGSGGGVKIITLIRFDDIFGDETERVPNDATIVSATLSLHVVDSASQPAALVYEGIQEWDEDTVTWNSYVGAGQDIELDVDLGPQIADADTRTGNGTSIPIDVTQSLERWLVTPAANRGWLIVGRAAATSPTLVQARESAVEAERPLLTVKWLASAPP